MTPRYAIYYAPDAGTELSRFGNEVIGYDAEIGASVPFPEGAPFDDPSWRNVTEEPRRYGFHATLKPPFALAEGVREADLVSAMRVFADGRRAFPVRPLVVASVGVFVALVPEAPEPEIDDLASDCVRRFDAFRRPLSADDRARRLASPLTERQVGHLDRWGYPYVFEDFRFHLTLTGPLAPPRREQVRAALADRFAVLRSGLRIDAVTLFRQDRRDLPFRVLARFPLGRGT